MALSLNAGPSVFVYTHTRTNNTSYRETDVAAAVAAVIVVVVAAVPCLVYGRGTTLADPIDRTIAKGKGTCFRVWRRERERERESERERLT